jgi:hypothetical protein
VLREPRGRSDAAPACSQPPYPPPLRLPSTSPPPAGKLGSKLSLGEVSELIWEIDDSLEGRLTWANFSSAYYRCRRNASGFEPRGLLYLIEFLLMDKDLSGSVSVDEAMQALTIYPKPQTLNVVQARRRGSSPRTAQLRRRPALPCPALTHAHAHAGALRATRQALARAAHA